MKKRIAVMDLGGTMKKWSKATAEDYITKVEKGKKEMGLTYWSAKDFLMHHKTMNKII